MTIFAVCLGALAAAAALICLACCKVSGDIDRQEEEPHDKS